MRKHLLLLCSTLIFSIFTTNAQTRLFIDPDFASYGYSHKTMGILPFATEINLRPRQLKKMQAGDLEKMEHQESLNIQESMYSWFLRRKQQNKLWVDVQDVTTTNAILAKHNITSDNISEYTSSEIAKILEVDALIRGNFQTSKPMSEGASIALGLLVGFYGVTNTSVIDLFIHDQKTGKVLVNYNKRVSGSIGSTTDQLINILMRKSSRRIPYCKPKKEMD